ncbi:MAG: carboxypeptidase-like regulatory domain-containing protein [Phycisphaerales bacterium]|nr:carboxypeptidase-like regulatory domain-containing protein [Phycisphaerales bacterium]
MTGSGDIPIAERRPARLPAVLGACLCLLSGCTGALEQREATVSVASPAGQPVAGASVRADPVVLRHPLNIGDYFRAEPQRLGVWQTGPDGRCAVKLLATRPTSLSVAAPGFLPGSLLVEPNSQQMIVVELSPLDLPGADPR